MTPWTVAHKAPLSMGILQARTLEWVAMTSSRGSSQPRIKPRSPALQVDSLPSEPPRKTKNTGVGSLSLLQGIFPTQGLNQGLLHCRWILYQLNHEGSPRFDPWVGKIPWRSALQPTPVFLPGESPWTEEPCGLQSMGSQRV